MRRVTDLRDLAGRMRVGGLDVRLSCTADDGLVIDPIAYRIVQETLTNALRYGADRTARLSVRCTPTEVTIRASNASSGSSGQGSGLGLVGMAERVSLLGGDLWHGLGSDGRFRVDARLPVLPS